MTDPVMADAATTPSPSPDSRPDFLVRLGLLLPCSVNDVEAAYRSRAKQAHPDAGGSTAEFTQLQSDYEAAREYAAFRSSRRGWLAANIERYAALQEVVVEIERRGGTVETQRPEWIARELGDDFAQVLDTVIAVRLTGPNIGLEDIEYLVSKRQSLGSLHRLDLSDSQIDNRGVRMLAALPTLRELNLNGSFAGNRTAAVLAEMPGLRRVHLADTFVSWLARLELRRRRRDLEVVTRRSGPPGARGKRAYRWVFRLLVLYMVAMFVATHIPRLETRFPGLRTWFERDKMIHFGIYFGFTMLLAFFLALRKTDRALRTGVSALGYLAIAIFVAMFAAADETTQPLTGRQLDFDDWVADMIGMASALVVFSLIQVYRHRPLAGVVIPPAGIRPDVR
jgi:VanZ family protein